jgi:site-specific DNA-methyltransferase (adenine-specific)
MTQGHPPVHAATRKAGARPKNNYGQDVTDTTSRAGATDRYPGSVVVAASVGATAKGRVHPQQKPELLLQSLIRTYTNPGELVADPFAGSGSTVNVAVTEGRRGVGWDLYFTPA